MFQLGLLYDFAGHPDMAEENFDKRSARTRSSIGG